MRACCCYASCVLSQLNPERTWPSFQSNRLHGCTTTIDLWKKIQWNRCHQMASLAFRFYQIQFRPGLRPGPSRGSLRRSPRPSSRTGRGDTPSPSLTPSTPSASCPPCLTTFQNLAPPLVVQVIEKDTAQLAQRKARSTTLQCESKILHSWSFWKFSTTGKSF